MGVDVMGVTGRNQTFGFFLNCVSPGTVILLGLTAHFIVSISIRLSEFSSVF